MHVLATNLCQWLRVLVYEIMEGIHEFDDHSIQAPSSDSLDDSDFQIDLFAGNDIV